MIEQMFSCFTSAEGMGIFQCFIGQSFTSIFGGYIALIGLFLLVALNILLFRLRLSPELIGIANVTLIGIFVFTLLPQWTWWLILIVLAFPVGIGIYKLLGRR